MCRGILGDVILRFSPSNRFLPFTRQKKCQVMFLFRLSARILLLRLISVFPLPSFFQVVCFELPETTLLRKTLCRSSIMLTVYLPSLIFFCLLFLFEEFAKKPNLHVSSGFCSSLFVLLFLDFLVVYLKR